MSCVPRGLGFPCDPPPRHDREAQRRAGKTIYLRQLLAERPDQVAPERALYLSFDDDRLAGVDRAQLGALLEVYIRRFPALRGRQRAQWLLDEIQFVSRI